jgi:prepilin-type N-terminal cleavage/methylation domain-containing protein
MPRNPRHGFTLVELLVVMGVIAILMSLLVPTLHMIRTQTNITRAESIIMGLSTALDQYKQIHYRYPPDKGTGTDAALEKSSECLVYYLSGGSIAYNPSSAPDDYPWKHDLYKDSTADGTGRRAWTIYYSFKENMLTDADKDKLPELKDPWDKRFIYNSGSGTDGSFNQYGAPKHNLRKYDLFAAGPDREYGTKDDIKNWNDSNPDDYDSLPPNA